MNYSYKHTVVKGAKYTAPVAAIAAALVYGLEQFGFPQELTNALYVVSVFAGVAVYDWLKHRIGLKYLP